MLTIKDLQASVEDKNILKGLNLDIKPGEITRLWALTVLVKVL